MKMDSHTSAKAPLRGTDLIYITNNINLPLPYHTLLTVKRAEGRDPRTAPPPKKLVSLLTHLSIPYTGGKAPTSCATSWI